MKRSDTDRLCWLAQEAVSTGDKNETDFNNNFFATVKPVLSGHSKRRPKLVYKTDYRFNAGQKYCRMLQESILQYFRPSLSYHLSLRPLFCLILSGRLRPVLLYFQRSNSTRGSMSLCCLYELLTSWFQRRIFHFFFINNFMRLRE